MALHPARPILHAPRFRDTSAVLEARKEPSKRADSSHQLLHDMSTEVRERLCSSPSHIATCTYTPHDFLQANPSIQTHDMMYIATCPAGSEKEQFLTLKCVKLLLPDIAVRSPVACTTEIELWERSNVRNFPPLFSIAFLPGTSPEGSPTK